MSSVALVLGGADCVWEDLDALEAITGPWSGVVIAANTTGALWPRRLDHWVTLHPEHMAPWIEAREASGYPDGFTVWAHEQKRWHSTRGRHLVDRTLEVPNHSGSAGLVAVDVARAIGCDRVVLCGVPMTATPHIHEAAPFPADRYWPRWQERRADLAPFVRSMSGRTRDLLGCPDAEWLMGVPC